MSMLISFISFEGYLEKVECGLFSILQSYGASKSSGYPNLKKGNAFPLQENIPLYVL
jgi:hypothetical protein